MMILAAIRWEEMLNYFTLPNGIEFLLLFGMIYWALYYLRDTNGAQFMAVCLVVLLILRVVLQQNDMGVLSKILEHFFDSLLLILMIIFQPELRRLLVKLGSKFSFSERKNRLLVDELCTAVVNMSKRKCGALIVIEGKESLQPHVEDAIPLDAAAGALMLESIFFPNSPLHDGAVIIRDSRIVAARVILPLTRSEELSPLLGTRHRAALGISEESDAVVVMVSEETGAINLAYDGELHHDLSRDGLKQMLVNLIVYKDSEEFRENSEEEDLSVVALPPLTVEELSEKAEENKEGRR